MVILFFQSLADPLLLVLSTNVTSGLLMWTNRILALFSAWLIASRIDVCNTGWFGVKTPTLGSWFHCSFILQHMLIYNHILLAKKEEISITPDSSLYVSCRWGRHFINKNMFLGTLFLINLPQCHYLTTRPAVVPKCFFFFWYKTHVLELTFVFVVRVYNDTSRQFIWEPSKRHKFATISIYCVSKWLTLKVKWILWICSWWIVAYCLRHAGSIWHAGHRHACTSKASCMVNVRV